MSAHHSLNGETSVGRGAGAQCTFMYDFNDCCALAPLPLKLDKNARQTVVAGEPDENHLLRRMHEMEAKQMSCTAKNGGKEKKTRKHLQPKTEEKKDYLQPKTEAVQFRLYPEKVK